MKISLLTFQIRYLRIYRNNGVRKLELICQSIDKLVIPDLYVMAGTRLDGGFDEEKDIRSEE